MNCSKCGTTLPAGSTFCPNCGTHYSQSSSIPPTQYASTSSSPAQTPLDPTQYASSPYITPAPVQAVPPAGPSTDPYSNPPYSLSNSSTDPYNISPYAPAPANPYSGSPYETGVAPPPPPRASVPGKRPPIAVIVGVVILLLLLAGGGIFFFAASKLTTSTSTPVTSSSVNSASLTVTAEASQALFFDNFANNSKGWTTGKTANSSETISNHMLILENQDANAAVNEFLPTSNPFSDFELVTTFTINQADKNDIVGISVRANDSSFDHDYHIQFAGDLTYEIGKDYNDSQGNIQGKVLSDYTKASALNSIGQPNTITIIIKGNTLVLLINNTLVKTLTDNDYATGQIAFYLLHGTTSSGVKASFSSVAVYPPPSQLPS